MKKSNLIATLITSVVLLSGCSGSGFNSNSNKNSGTTDSIPEVWEMKDYLPTFDTSKQIEITFWHTMGDSLETILKGIIADFNKEYPTITVNATSVGGYPDVRDAVIKNIPVDSTPNLAYCYPDHVAIYRNSNAVQALDEYLMDTKYGLTNGEREKFVEGFYQEGRSFGDGKNYALPFVKSTEVLYYDATYFAQNQLKVPTTWDELWAVCESIKANNPDCIPFGYDSEANWFITNAEQNGYTYTTADKSHGVSGHFQFNVKGNRDFVSDLKTKYDKGLFTTEEMYGAYTSGLFTADQNKSYLCIGSTGGAQYQYSDKFETGIATIPQKAGGKDAVISQGPSICMFEKADQQQEIASWLFLKYLTTNVKAQSTFAQASGYIPSYLDAQNSTEYQKYLNGASGTSKAGVTALAAKVAVDQSDKYFTSPAFVGSSQARDEVGNIIVNVLGGTAVETAFDDAIQACIEAVS